MKILIVEDTESVRFALRLALEYLGHEVVETAMDGEEALEKYVRFHPEIVFMDVKMPRMDGLTCTSLLAKCDPNVKVIIVTGGRSTESDARHAGARGFVEKPFEIAHLKQLIGSLAAA